MRRRRRRRGRGKAWPLIVATIIGLAIAGGIYWQQNPDFELRAPSGLVERVGDLTTGERAPESFAAITATSTPDEASRDAPAANAGAERTAQADRPVGQVTSESRENREARGQMEAADRVSELELKVHAGINAERAKNGSPPLEWEGQLGSVARAHSEDMTRRGYFSHDTPEGRSSLFASLRARRGRGHAVCLAPPAPRRGPHRSPVLGDSLGSSDGGYRGSGKMKRDPVAT